MTHRPDDDDPTRGERRDAQAFDGAARAAHADALTHVSARVQAQLQQRRRAALSGRPRADATRRWPMLAAGGAAALALAVGLRFAHPPAEMPTAPSVATRTGDARTPMAATPPGIAPAAVAGADTSADTPTSTPRATPAANGGADATMAEVDALLADDGAAPSTGDRPMPALADDTLLADLEENPDLYLWLGSDESQADTTEVL